MVTNTEVRGIDRSNYRRNSNEFPLHVEGGIRNVDEFHLSRPNIRKWLPAEIRPARQTRNTVLIRLLKTVGRKTVGRLVFPGEDFKSRSKDRRSREIRLHGSTMDPRSSHTGGHFRARTRRGNDASL